MTEKELQQVYFLRKEIDMWESKLNELSDIKAVRYDSSGSHGSGTSDPVLQLVEKRDQIRRIIADKQAESRTQEAEITKYIMTVDDSLIRQIMYKRHIELKSWPCIAKEIGSSPDSLRMAYRRFLKSS